MRNAMIGLPFARAGLRGIASASTNRWRWKHAPRLRFSRVDVDVHVNGL